METIKDFLHKLRAESQRPFKIIPKNPEDQTSAELSELLLKKMYEDDAEFRHKLRLAMGFYDEREP